MTVFDSGIVFCFDSSWLPAFLKSKAVLVFLRAERELVHNGPVAIVLN